MPSEPKRKLAAIMFTDMVGYTAMMQKDEDRARELIERHRDLMKPHINKHDGEIIQYVGDGTFCRFDSAKEAVNAALEIQHVFQLEDDMSLRIGIHVGDVVVKGDEVYGDGVNVASRLEPLAEAGGICVSHQVYENIKNQSGLSLASLGKKDLKNVDEEMEVFTVTRSSEPSHVTTDTKKPTSTSSKFNMRWIVTVAVITILVIIGTKIDFGTKEGESKREINSLSIAVLPFTNMNADAENEFFANGITEDIITQLSKISSLEVISRTSIMQYKNTTKSIREIGNELGVATILEGSVRREGNRVRITAQLIDTETDKHLWADNYDRDMDDIFAIQSDVAKKIAEALEASLTPEEEKRIDKKLTDNIEAYNYYLRGNDYTYGSNNKNDFEIGIELYQKAIDLDPGFSNAYSRLSRVHSDMYWFHFDRTEERLNDSKEAVDKALSIDAELPQAHVVLGWYYYHGYLDYEKALKEFEIANELGHNSSDLYSGIAAVQRRQGRFMESVVNFGKATELDPRTSDTHFNEGQTYALLRMYDNAVRILNRAISLSPDQMINYWNLTLIHLSRDRDFQKAQGVIDKAEQNVNSLNAPLLLGMKYILYIYQKQYGEALKMLSLVEEATIDDQFQYVHKFHSKGLLYGYLGNSELENSYYDSARVMYEKLVRDNPEDSRLYSSLGIVYAGLGRKEDALRAGKKGVDLLPISKEAWRGAYRVENLAVIYTMVGKYDLALDQIETLLSMPSDLSVNLLRLNSKWDPLREHPRFISLLQEHGA